MSHEVRTPLNGVIGMADLLKATGLSGDQNEYVETIRMSGEALLSVLNDILDFSKSEAGKMRIESAEFDLVSSLRDLVATLEPSAARRDLKLVCRLAPNLPPAVRGDWKRIRQILLNLLDNAMKFTRAGRIDLEVTTVEEESDACHVSFTIKDIRDNHGYLDALGKPRTAMVLRDAEIARAEAKRDADIAKAEAERDATIRSANARQAGETNRYGAETKIAESARDYEMERADYNASVNEKRADADLAYDLSKHKKQQQVKKEEVQVEVVEKQQRVLVQEQEILRRTKELEATVHKPADAKRYQVQTEAEAERFRLEAEAKGRAEAERQRGIAEASVIEATGRAEAEAVKAHGLADGEAIRAKGLAQADATKAQGLSEAEAMNEKADAWHKYGEAALIQMVVDALPRMAEAVSAPLSKTDRITIVGGGGPGGAGASKVTQDVTDIVSQVPPVVESLTGVDLSSMLRTAADKLHGETIDADDEDGPDAPDARS